MKTAVRLAVATALVSVLGLLALALWLRPLQAPVAIPEQSLDVLEVRSGESLSTLLHRLNSEGWNLPETQLKLYARLKRLDRSIRAGDYSLQQCCRTATALLHLLTSGQQMTYRFTLVEGWDLRRAVSELAKAEKVRHTLGEGDARAIAQLMGLGYESAEGLFYPDTYSYASGESDLDILKRARQKQKLLLSQLWEERAGSLPYTSPYEAIILASIVEREARLVEESPKIAGVYTSRLRRDMRLEADPTVIYGLGNDYSRRLTRQDLRTDTPWNTYVRKGLPLTPIGLPGEAALRAALQPKESDMLFFVARGDGSHVFSPTLREHHANVRRIRARQSKK